MKRTLPTSIQTVLLALALAIQPCLAPAASPSELLEKGIYTEETKGDVDAAIAIYQQLVAEAKTAHSLAAQAQFRLAQCYLKKNRRAEAMTAFEKLIRDFPHEKELVAQAREHLPGEFALQPVPWADGERLQLALSLTTGFEVGAVEYRADLAEVEGRKVWRVGARMYGGGSSVSSVDADAETFHPRSSRWKHTLLGEVFATYRTGEVETKRAGGTETTKISVDRVIFDNEQAMHLMRRLPLKIGYQTTIPVLSTLGGGITIPIAVEVTDREAVEVAAGKFECFKVQTKIGQTFWFSDDAHRYLIKFEGGGAVGKLVSITQRKAGEDVSFRDEELRISFSAPADWLICRFKSGQPAKQSLIRTFDPDADTTDGGLRLFATDALPEAARGSSRAWAEAMTKGIKNGSVRPESWKEYQVDGLTGVGHIFEFKDGDKQQVQLLVNVIGPKTSELFVVTSAPDKFEGLKAEFERIIASYKRW